MATWTISTMERNTSDDGVIVAHWRVTEVETVGEETYSASAYGTASFTPDASADDFVPYADLTETMVLDWCWDNGVDQTEIEASLAANIAEQKNPVSVSGTPWS